MNNQNINYNICANDDEKMKMLSSQNDFNRNVAGNNLIRDSSEEINQVVLTYDNYGGPSGQFQAQNEFDQISNDLNSNFAGNNLIGGPSGQIQAETNNPVQLHQIFEPPVSIIESIWGPWLHKVNFFTYDRHPLDLNDIDGANKKNCNFCKRGGRSV